MNVTERFAATAPERQERNGPELVINESTLWWVAALTIAGQMQVADG